MAVGSRISFIAPGIYSIERDLSQVPAAAVRLGGAFVGLTLKGPAFLPKRIQNFGEFRTVFGGFWNRGSYLPYTVNSYFQGGGLVATIVRVLGKGDPNNGNVTDYGRAFWLCFPAAGTFKGLTAVDGSVGSPAYTSALSAVEILAVLRSRVNSGSDAILNITYTGSPTNFDMLIGPSNTWVRGVSLDRTSKNYIRNILSRNKQKPSGGDTITGLYVDTVLDYRLASFVGSVTGIAPGSFSSGLSGLSTVSNGIRYVTGGYSNAHSPSIISQPYYNATGDIINANATVYDLFTLYTLGDGAAANGDVKVYIQDVQTTSDNSTDPTIALKFTVVVRQYSDTDKKPVVYETFRCSLDPNADQYIARVIGDRYQITTIDSPGGVPVSKWVGEFPNRSNFIRVAVNEGNYPFDARPAGFRGPAGMQALALTSLTNANISQIVYEQDWPNKTNFLDTNNIVSNRVYPGWLFDGSSAIGGPDRLQASFGSVDAAIRSKGFLIKAVPAESEFWMPAISSANNTLTAEFNSMDITLTGLSATTTYSVATNVYQFGFPLFGGNDGISPWKDPIEAINDGTLSAEYQSALNALANPDEIDINLLNVPGVHCGANAYNGQFTNNAIAMCEDRGDCFYIMDCGLTTQGTTAALDSAIDDVVSNIAGYDSNYAATYYPWLRIQDTDVNRLVWVPPSVLMAGVYSFTDAVAAPWYAPAGVNRGILPNAVEARRRLAIDSRETLYKGRINPINTRVNIGIFVDGQKTLQARASALDRVNVRRLMIAVKKSIAALCLRVQYENNTAKVRQQLKSILEPSLQRILLRQGITRFQIDIDDTNNTFDTIDRNELHGRIIIEPARSIELIILDYIISKSGSSFREIIQNI